MLIGLAGGALWALDTVILGMALALPVFTGDPRAAILAPFASTFCTTCALPCGCWAIPGCAANTRQYGKRYAPGVAALWRWAHCWAARWV